MTVESDRGGGGANREGGEGEFDILTAGVGIGEQRVDGAFDESAAVFGADDNSRVDLTRFNQPGDQEGAVEQTQAGVADIEHHAALGQPGAGVDGAGGGGFELVATDRAMDEAADAGGIETGLLKRLLNGEAADVARAGAAGEEAPLADAGPQFEAACGEAQAVVDGGEAGFEVV